MQVQLHRIQVELIYQVEFSWARFNVPPNTL